MREIDYGNLVAKAKESNEQAITKLYEATYKNAYFTSYQILKDKHEAEDVLQECYIKAFQKLDMLKKPGSFPSWINRIVSNRSIDIYRKKKPLNFSQLTNKEEEDGKEIDFEDDKESYRPEIVADKKETARLLGEIIETLSDEQRIVVTMFYFQGMTVKEIAKDLEVSENTIKSRLNYGRKKIEKEVLTLEKKGTKLYGLAPIPFLLLLMETNAEAATVSGTVIGGIITGTASTAGTVGAGAIGVAGTATTAAKAAGGAVVKKILVGALIAGVTIGGGTFAYTKLKPENTTNAKQEERTPDKEEIKADLSNYKLQDYVKIVEGKEGRPDTIELNIDSSEAKKINKELNEKINRYYDKSGKIGDGDGFVSEKIIVWEVPEDESELYYDGYTGYSNNITFNVNKSKFDDNIMTLKIDLNSRSKEDGYTMFDNENMVYNIDKNTSKILYLKDFLKREGKTIDDIYNSVGGGTNEGFVPYEYGTNLNRQIGTPEITAEPEEYKFTGEEMFDVEKIYSFGNEMTKIDIYPNIDKNSVKISSDQEMSVKYSVNFKKYELHEFNSENGDIKIKIQERGTYTTGNYDGALEINGKKYSFDASWNGNDDPYVEELGFEGVSSYVRIDGAIYNSEFDGIMAGVEGDMIGEISLVQPLEIINHGIEDEYLIIKDKIRANIKLNSGENFSNIELKLK